MGGRRGGWTNERNGGGTNWWKDGQVEERTDGRVNGMKEVGLTDGT